jgi:hypothetical protein
MNDTGEVQGTAGYGKRLMDCCGRSDSVYHYYCNIQTENIKHFVYRVVRECTERMAAG